MSLIFDSIVLAEFSSDKIIKFLHRYKINVSSTELDEIIKNSYSTEQVKDQLLASNPSSRIIMNNLERFVARYWELNFPDKLSIEKIFFEITKDFIDKMDFKSLGKVLVKFAESFARFKALMTNNTTKDEIINRYSMFLKNWFISYLLVFYNVSVHSELVINAFESFESFLKDDINFLQDPDLSFIFELTKIKIEYNFLSKDKAYELLTDFSSRYPSSHGVLFLKGLLLSFDFDLTEFTEYISNLNSFLKDPDYFFDDYELERLIILLENISEKGHQKQNSLLKSSIETAKMLQDRFAKAKKTKKEKFNDESDIIIQNISLFPAITIINKTVENNVLKNYKKYQYKFGFYEILEQILKKDIPIKITFECVNCALIYSEEFKQIVSPDIINNLLKNKPALADNGTFLFDQEIVCPGCASFKFAFEKYSRLFLINLYSYASSKAKKEKSDKSLYDIKDPENPVIVTQLEFNFIKKPKNLYDAIDQLVKAIKKHPKDGKYLKEKGDILMLLNDYNEAKKSYLDALEKDPNDFETMLRILKILKERKQFDQCKKIIYDIIAKIGDNESLFTVNYPLLKELQKLVNEIKDSKLSRQYKTFIEK